MSEMREQQNKNPNFIMDTTKSFFFPARKESSKINTAREES